MEKYEKLLAACYKVAEFHTGHFHKDLAEQVECPHCEFLRVLVEVGKQD